MWVGMAAVMVLMVMARTFSLPSSVILVTRAAPSSAVLGRVHGVAASLASLSKAVGPAGAGALFAVGMRAGVVGVAWWAVAGAAGVGFVFALLVREDIEDDEDIIKAV